MIDSFKFVFRVFFQPLELESALKRDPRLHKRAIWGNLVLALVWYGTYFCCWCFLFYKKFGLSGEESIELPLTSISLICLAAFCVVIPCGVIFKRESMITILVGLYYSMLASVAWLAIFPATNSKNHDILAYHSTVVLATIIICLIIANLSGKTRGIKPVLCIASAVALWTGVTTLTHYRAFDTTEDFLLENGPKKGLLIDSAQAKLEFTDLLLSLPDTSKGRYGFFFADFDREEVRSYKKPSNLLEHASLESYPSATSCIISDDLQKRLNSKDSEFLNKIRDKIKQMTGPELSGQDVASLSGSRHWDDRFLLANCIVHRIQLGPDTFSVVGELPVVPFNSDDNSVFSALRYQDGVRYLAHLGDSSKYRDAALNYSRKYDVRPPPLFYFEAADVGVYAEWAESRQRISAKDSRGKRNLWNLSADRVDIIPLNDDLIFVQTKESYKALNNRDGRPKWQSGSWYYSRFGTPDDSFLADNSIYGVSPSGYAFEVQVTDGALLHRLPVFANEIIPSVFKTFGSLVAYYLLGITMVLCFGLYRIPAYAVESVLQFGSFLCLSGKDPARAVRASPLLFEHVSALPLPFSRKLLRRAARQSPQLVSEQLIYLAGKTQQQKLAGGFFGEFHRENPTFLFECIYKLLRFEDLRPLEVLAARVPDENPISSVLHSYGRLLGAGSKQGPVKSHATIMRSFADNGYLHAPEILSIYRVFCKCFEFKNLEELADAYTAFASEIRVSENDPLTAPVGQTLDILAELANDLKNSDLVDSFRDKQYYLSEARIKLYEVTRRAREDIHDPERSIILDIVDKWQPLIIGKAMTLRGPAELKLTVVTKALPGVGEWQSIRVDVKNEGQSPAENVRVSMLENENVQVMDREKTIRLMGTGEAVQFEFSILPQGNLRELRCFFDTVFDDFERKGKLRAFADILKLSQDTTEFKSFPNPYIVGTPLQSDKVFFGRSTALDFALENLSGGAQNNILIYFGQRRIGKSSILYRLMDSPLKADYVFVYIDCQGFADADTAKLLYRICRDICSSMLKSQITIEPPELKKFKENTFLELDDYLDKVERLLGTRRMVLMFDEYEFLEYKVSDGSVSREIFNKLRNIMQHRNKVLAFIFVGTHRLTELTADHWSFLFNTALYHEIGPLGDEAARALISEPVQGFLRYDDLAIDKILRVTGRHPYFIQVTCRLMVNYANKKQKSYVTLTDLNEVLGDAVEGSTAHVKYLYKDFANKPEQEVLAFLSRVTDETKLYATVGELSHFAAANQFPYDSKQLRDVLLGLKNKQLVREDGELRGELYGFGFEFLRLWILEHVKAQGGSITVF